MTAHLTTIARAFLDALDSDAAAHLDAADLATLGEAVALRITSGAAPTDERVQPIASLLGWRNPADECDGSESARLMREAEHDHAEVLGRIRTALRDADVVAAVAAWLADEEANALPPPVVPTLPRRVMATRRAS